MRPSCGRLSTIAPHHRSDNDDRLDRNILAKDQPDGLKIVTTRPRRNPSLRRLALCLDGRFAEKGIGRNLLRLACLIVSAGRRPPQDISAVAQVFQDRQPYATITRLSIEFRRCGRGFGLLGEFDPEPAAIAAIYDAKIGTGAADDTIYRGLCARRAKGRWRSTIISLVAGVIRKRQTCATVRQQMLINAG
jgi:hypothetical protein